MAPRYLVSVMSAVTTMLDTAMFVSLSQLIDSFDIREMDYYRKTKEDGPKSEVFQLIEKQFKIRRGSQDTSDKVTPEVSLAEMEAIRKSRLIAAASTSVKVTGLKITVSRLFTLCIVILKDIHWGTISFFFSE